MKLKITSTEETKLFGEIENGTYFFFDGEGEIFIKTNDTSYEVNAIYLCRHSIKENRMLEFSFHENDVVNICTCETSFER